MHAPTENNATPGHTLQWQRSAPRLAVVVLLVLAAAAVLGALAPWSTSRAADGFTIHVSPKTVPAGDPWMQIGNDSYGSLKGQLTALADDEGVTTIVFSALTASKLVGLPALTGEAGSAEAYFDDDEFDITVLFDSTYQDQDVQVLVSARWKNAAVDFTPEIAVVLRIDAIDLATLNPSFDAFPVNFSNVLVGFSNVDHTLVANSDMGTGDFFDDGVPSSQEPPPADQFRIIGGGAGLQALVVDNPDGPDPLLEGAGVLGGVETILVKGAAGKVPGAEEDSTIKALDLTAAVTVSTPAELSGAGVVLDDAWSLQITANSAGVFFGRFSGGAGLNLGSSSTPTSFDAALSISYDKANSKADFKLEGTVGDLDDLFGQTWFDLKQFKVAVTISRNASATPPTTTYGIAMNANLTLGGVTANAGLVVKVGSDTEVGLTLGVTQDVAIADILTALNAPAVDDGVKVTLTNFGLNVTVKKPATGATTVTVVATGGAKLLERTCAGTVYPGGNAGLLFRLQLGGATTNFMVGASVTGLNTKNLSCDIPFEWSLPDVMLLLANTDITTGWAGVDAPTKTFLTQYFCGVGGGSSCNDLQRFICPVGSTIPCAVGQQNLTVKSGLSLHALIEIDGDLVDALEAIEIHIADGSKLRVSGTVPLFGGTDLALTVALPTITNPDQDAVVASADIHLEIAASTEGVKAEIAGAMTFRVERANQTTCNTAGMEADGTLSSGKCYDELSLTVGFGIETTVTPPSFKLNGFAVLGNWQNAFGEPNLTIESFALEITVEGPVFGLKVGMGGKLLLGDTDLTLAIEVKLTATPPSIALTGLTVGSAKGVALRDIVKTFSGLSDTEVAGVPDLSLKNIWFAYGTETNNTLCIRQGLFISAELHLNDPNPNSGAGTNPACGGSGVPLPNCGTAGEASCLAAVQVDIGPKRFKLYGALAAFDLGPLAFDGAEVLIDLTLLKQEIYFKGAATLYDPISYYLNDPDGTETVWASGYLKLEVKQNAGVFSLALNGCALLGGTAKASEDCPTSASTVFQAQVVGSIEADFKKVGLKFFEDATADFDLTLSAPALAELAEDIEEQLRPVATFFDDTGDTVTGTYNEVATTVTSTFCTAFDPNCASLNVTAAAYTNAPAYLQAEIDATDSAIRDSAAVNLYCFATFQWPVDECVQGYRDQAKTANQNTIAAHGGALYIALHGIDATGYGGIVDADFGTVYVNATTFKWPESGPALCDVGGLLHGLSVCSAAPGESVDLDDLIGPVLLEALREIDPDIAALFDGGGQASALTAAGGMALSQTAADPGKFVEDVRKLAATFDLGKPLGVCEAKTSIKFGPAGVVGTTALQTKVDAFGGKSIIGLDVKSGENEKAELDKVAIKKDVITDVLKAEVTSLECPVATPAGVLSFAMSASEINEGGTITLTGKALASAVVTVQWGDGSANSTATANASGVWTASHQYLDGPATRVIKANAEGAPQAASLLSVLNVAPTITLVTPPASANEAGEVTLAGTYADPGTLDTQKVTVNWGDGTTTTTDLAAGGTSFSLKHTYADDNPTSTTEDTYAIAITLTDKDGGKDTDSASVVIKNVAPSDLKLTGATWVGGQATTDAAGNLVVPEGVVVTWAGTFKDVGTSDTHNVVIDWGDGNFGFAAVARDATDPTLVHFTFIHQFADDHPATGTASDLVQLKIQVRDDDTGAAEVQPKARVSNVAPAVSTTPATQQVQYSDPLAKVVLTAIDVRGYVALDGTFSETLQTSTRWKVDDGDFEDGLFADLALAADGCEVTGTGAAAIQTCEWSVEGIADVAPGTYTIEFTVVDDDTGKTTKTVDVVVLPEDARATYTGPTVISAPSLADGHVDIMLRATVRDSSVVAELNPPDKWPGDITNATVTFVDRETGATLCEAPVVPIFVGDTTTGGAACVANLRLPAGKSSHTFDIGTVVGGWYLRDDASEDAAVTIEKPTADWVTGGDELVVAVGAGVHAPGGNTQVNLSTGWNKPRLDALTGMLRIRFASGGRQYELAVTSFDSVGTTPGATNKVGSAQIEARATLFDITASADNPVTVATDLRLQFRVTDNGKSDTASFAVWGAGGLLLAASAWDGTKVPATALPSGKLQVHFD